MDEKTEEVVAKKLEELHGLVRDARDNVNPRKQPEVWGPLDKADAILQGLSIPFMRARKRMDEREK